MVEVDRPVEIFDDDGRVMDAKNSHLRTPSSALNVCEQVFSLFAVSLLCSIVINAKATEYPQDISRSSTVLALGDVYIERQPDSRTRTVQQHYNETVLMAR